jgi:hypothetical protein
MKKRGGKPKPTAPNSNFLLPQGRTKINLHPITKNIWFKKFAAVKTKRRANFSLPNPALFRFAVI